jgi:hypothetical protein
MRTVRLVSTVPASLTAAVGPIAVAAESSGQARSVIHSGGIQQSACVMAKWCGWEFLGRWISDVCTPNK